MLLLFKPLLFAQALDDSSICSPSAFYAGFAGGYGSTTWKALVPSTANQSSILLVSIPENASEGGLLWGFFGGYEFNPHFALEGAYWHYPRATITFSQDSIFAFERNNRVSFESNTDVIAMLAKIMIFFPKSRLRIYSGLGPASIHRRDELLNEDRLTAAFAGGFIYPFTEHIMGHAGFNYTAGYGESELTPVNNFIPFLYAGFLGLAFRF